MRRVDYRGCETDSLSGRRFSMNLDLRPAASSVVLLLVTAGCTGPRAPHSSSETFARASASPASSEKPSSPPPSATAPEPSASVKDPAPPRSTLLPKGSEQGFYGSLQKIVLETSGASNRFELVEARLVRFPRADRIVVTLRIEPEICAFGIINPETGAGVYVPGFDYACKDIRFVADDDFNGDGVPDFQYQLVVRSNRYDADVDEGSVFLSIREQESYCYGERLQLLTGRGGWTRSILPEVRDLAAREGPSVFECKQGY
jgi:hypothetical protein